jgi:hypothetical protein
MRSGSNATAFSPTAKPLAAMLAKHGRTPLKNDAVPRTAANADEAL